ncbi:hypothetical protein COO60DRAFT_581645 [Scenedesmus sp. NREL 46B-D3]|nr:hypothetical protein COO60DRAFT_581645 [Scenedesmus sp. NREL 46B-D3]
MRDACSCCCCSALCYFFAILGGLTFVFIDHSATLIWPLCEYVFPNYSWQYGGGQQHIQSCVVCSYLVFDECLIDSDLREKPSTCISSHQPLCASLGVSALVPLKFLLKSGAYDMYRAFSVICYQQELACRGWLDMGHSCACMQCCVFMRAPCNLRFVIIALMVLRKDARQGSICNHMA